MEPEPGREACCRLGNNVTFNLLTQQVKQKKTQHYLQGAVKGKTIIMISRVP